ncbi:MAG TPA: hypothetical protein VJ732_06170, partial [Bryobacteraceae bacterium]|nr:hypothetical protein [Bryobacteraceae bacterium]
DRAALAFNHPREKRDADSGGNDMAADVSGFAGESRNSRKRFEPADKELRRVIALSITPISNVSAFAALQQAQNQPPANKNSNSSQSPVDTVQLSSAALAHLSGAGDVDHDGDSH